MKNFIVCLGLLFSSIVNGQPVSLGERIIYIYDEEGQLLNLDNEHKVEYHIDVEYDRQPFVSPETLINDKGIFGGYFDRRPNQMSVYLIHKKDTMIVRITHMSTYFTLDGIRFQAGRYEVPHDNKPLPSKMLIRDWEEYRVD